MGSNLFVSEILMVTITLIAFAVFWQLMRSKNGVLRKIMMGYFLIEVYVYGFSVVYWWLVGKGKGFDVELFRVLVIVPKAIMMLILLRYLIKQKTN
jgi:hypothetical protein